ncbi:hypothetical protein N9213_01300 [Akkermansiaceae bacterium]|nr:hypothetical protein [Akkermansiaceae bacterium]
MALALEVGDIGLLFPIAEARAGGLCFDHDKPAFFKKRRIG